MPKTTQRPQREALPTWSPSSDDDSSLPYARPMPSPRQRFYGKRRPIKKPGRSSRFDSKPSSKVSSSLQTKRPTSTSEASSSRRRSRKHVIEKDSDSSASDKEIQAPKKSASRSRSKNDSRRSLDRAPPSYPAFTPIVPKKARRNKTPRPHVRPPIRVNLTPDPSDMPKGWLTKSQLVQVASRHNGMAIQYRVMYHASQKPIRDHNTGATRKIRYKDVVVQSRFACVSGSHGGSTYSFMRWKLPGTLLQSRKAKHITIYDDTRPRLPQNGQKETSHPLIILCSELKDADRRMAERFLCDAEAGMTPEEFYSQKQGTASQQDDSSKASLEVGNAKEDSPVALQEKDDDIENTAVSELENEAPTTVLDKREKHRDSRPKPTPLGESSSGNKRALAKGGESNTTKRARKKDYGGARNRRRNKVTFQIGEDDSSAPQSLALIEGVAGAKSCTKGPDEKAEDYIRDVFMNGRVEKLPLTGRVMELHDEAKPGAWTGELVDVRDRSTFPGKGMMRDKIGNLKDVRILLRHDSASTMGPLNLPRSGSMSPLSDYSPGIERRIRGGGVSSTKSAKTVSLIEPSHSRRHDLLSQGILCREAMHDSVKPFIGSISIAGFDGFTSSTDARLSACSTSACFLKSCHKKVMELEAQRLSSTGFLEDVLPIPVTGTCGSEHEYNVGVSFVCKVGLEDSYALLVANDEDGHIVAVDIVFDQALFENSRSSVSSTASRENHRSRLTERVLQRHSADMELARPENPADDSSAYSSEGNVGMILDSDFEKPSLPESPSAHVSTDASHAEDIDDVDRVNTVVTIDPTPSTDKHMPRADSAAKAPKSILKNKKQYESRAESPAPMIAHEVKEHSCTSSIDETDVPTTSHLPSVTPTPRRERQTRNASDGFLPLLDQVADSELEFPGGTGNVECSEENDEDVFEDPLNEEIDVYESDQGGMRLSAVAKDSARALSPRSSWPSVLYDAIYGLHDEEEYPQVMSEEMEDISRAAETMPMYPSAAILDGPLCGPEKASHHRPSVPAASSHRSLIRGSSFSVGRILLAAFILWHATLAPNSKKEIPRVLISRRPATDPSFSTPTFFWQ